MLQRILVYLLLFCASFYHSMDAGEPIQVEMLIEQETIQQGHPFWVALHFQLEDQWHVYWKNPGDAGMAPQISWQLPEGYSVKNILWPTPNKYTSNESITYGYENEAIILAEILPPKNITGEQTISANIRFVACDEFSCVPGEAFISAPVLAQSSSPQIKESLENFFLKARREIPENGLQGSATKLKDTITLSLSSADEVIDASFFPDDLTFIDHTAEVAFTQSDKKSGRYDIHLKAKENSFGDEPLKGVVVFKSKNNDIITTKAYGINLAVVENSHDFASGLIFALMLAFAGGLLLNFMPCVLPVISFKVLSFVKMAGDSRARMLKHSVAFSAGVLFSFWVLAGVLLSLQAYGHAIGWGFQLQEPLFVASLASVILVFGLSMFGVFEMGAGFASKAGQAQMGSQSFGLNGSFFSGILATAVATPCTGPFLGTAVGFAVTLPAIQGMLIFTSLALGMAFPYLMLGAFPQLLKFLPKPGNWMVTFKEMMGFLMIATVLWLVWVFGAQTDALAVFFLLTGFFFLSIACWIYGKWGSPVKKKKTRLISYVFSLSFITLGGYALFFSSTIPSYYPEEAEGKIVNNVVWEKFSPERLIALQEAGIPVFVDFTAKWCLICQANHLVLSSNAVSKKFDELGVVRMKADWTKNNPMITQELKKYGRNSVPLYLLYNAESGNKPIILPQVLTPDNVIEKLVSLK